jgi:hypothetical protein
LRSLMSRAHDATAVAEEFKLPDVFVGHVHAIEDWLKSSSRWCWAVGALAVLTRRSSDIARGAFDPPLVNT